MNIIIAILLHTLTPSSGEVVAFQETSPHDLTYVSAEEHLVAARFAGLVYGVSPELLLSVAWHESRYTNAQTREPGHRWSCGPMTPVPHRSRCSRDELTTVGGYLKGAEHLKMWVEHCHGSERCAVTSFAGGSGLVKVCARYGRSINAFHHNACRMASDISARTRVIQRALVAGAQ